MVRFFVFACFILSASTAFAQKGVKDTTVFSPHFGIHYSYQAPGGDLAERFGNNSNVGASFSIKDRHNFYYGVDFGFIFGTKVTEPGLMQNLRTENGDILDNSGQIAKVLTMQRGFTVTVNGGYLFDIIGPNPNSGILVKGGIGIMQHKIRLEHQENSISQLEDEYLKGYDRLTNGLVLSEFIGYYHMSNSRLANFFIGVEAYQGFTKSRREYNFDTQMKDEENRLDLLYGVKVGWVIHLRKRQPDDYYIY